MTIKRYFPKYKILAKLKHALWLEKRKKVNKFSRQKWSGKKKLYFPRKLKVFDQDSSTYSVGHEFESDRSVRLKKTYKQLLLDKQAFQLYYGARRLRNYHLKYMGLCAKRLGQRHRISPSKVFFHLMENRFEFALYRIGIVPTLGLSRRLQSTARVMVGNNIVKDLGYGLKQNDVITLENFKFLEILARYLKFNVPFFYFQNREGRRQKLFVRKEFLKNSYFGESILAFLSLVKILLLQRLELQGERRSLVVMPKVYLTKIHFNGILSKSALLSGFVWKDLFCPNSSIKICVYSFLKNLKKNKVCASCQFSNFAWKFQLNGFYSSLVEVEKKRLVNSLKGKINFKKNDNLVTNFFQKPSVSLDQVKTRTNFSAFSNGMIKFQTLYGDYSNLWDNRRIFFQTLKTKRYFSNIFFSRLFLHVAAGKKNTKVPFSLSLKEKGK